VDKTLAKNLTKLLDIYEQTRKIIAYVKDEGFNLSTITTTLKSIESCDVLNLEEIFHTTCFGHAFSKACQHARTNEKVYKSLRYVSIKVA
jgi:hypothetical protein